MRILLLRLFFIPSFFITMISPAQESAWLTFLGGPGPQFATDIRQTFDSGYIVAGYASEGLGGNYYIVKLDPAGNVLWERNLSKDNYTERAYTALETTDSCFVITGNATMLNRPWVVKLDRYGDTMWTSQWTDTLPQNSAVLARGTLLPDGRIAVIGAAGQLGTQPNIFLVSQSGDLIGTRILVAPVPPGWYSGTVVTHVETTSDGGFILTGTAGGGSSSKAFLWKFDQNADSSWSVVYNDPVIGMRSASSVKQLVDGGYILAGYSSPNSEHTCLVRTDSYGSVLWSATYPDSVYTQGTDVIEWNGIFLVTEKRFEAFGETIFETGLLKVDQTGMIISRDIITAPSESVAIYRLRNTSDGGFVMAGEINEVMIPNEQDLFVLKSDPYGDIANAYFEIIVGMEEFPDFTLSSGDISLSPNPVRQGMMVTTFNPDNIQRIDIYNTSGQIIKSITSTAAGGFQFYAPTKPGWYLIAFSDQSGTTLLSKLIVQ